jgi:hypothetical protein
MQNITQIPHPIEILPNQVHVNYDDTDEGKDRVPHLRKFENVKRLIELHWLEGFPLWGCLAGTCDSECCGGLWETYSTLCARLSLCTAYSAIRGSSILSSSSNDAKK